jgi:membrane protease YdiL (CAAX protease family)
LNYPSEIPVWIAAILAAWLVISLCAYGYLLRRLSARGGKVATDALGPPDAGLACFFIIWFGWLAYGGFRNSDRAVNDSDLLAGAIHVALIVLVIASFLRFRKISLADQFGLRFSGIFMAAVFAVPLMTAAFPLVSCAGAIMVKLLGTGAKQQELVEFFTEASSNGKIWPVISTMAFGVFIAPAAEEFIFRGYLYPTVKKYLGLFPAMILTAGLFAAIHVNLTSLPSLFILAVCFTVAYETTGSILVPMAMHALFNLGEFSMMLAYPNFQP